MIIATNDLMCRVEKHFHKYILQNTTYETQSVNSINLLTYDRLDLGFKLFYLAMKNKNKKLAKEIYEDHIRAFSLGTFKEPGDDSKNNIDDFLMAFENIFDSIKNDGFDSNRTILPLSNTNSILNGSHRLASSVFLNKTVECFDLEMNSCCYDYKFFYSRGVSVGNIELAVNTFLNYSNNVYIAFIWPSAAGKDDLLEEYIPNILYKKSVKLNRNGAHNLLSQLYKGEKWVGCKENGFAGVESKLLECFCNFDPVRIIFFQANSLEEVLNIKELIRNIFKIGKHSIHITDNQQEAIDIGKVILNSNNIHFLNYSKPTKFLSVYNQISIFKKFIQYNNAHPDDVILDGSMVLAAYGVRDSRDIDYLSVNILRQPRSIQESISEHSDNLINHFEIKEDLLYDPKFYFYFSGLKFISFNQIYRMKKNRGEKKDKNDLSLMDALVENNTFKDVISRIKQNILYRKLKLKSNIVIILRCIGLFEIARSMMKGKR